jgi:hypothetical protein
MSITILQPAKDFPIVTIDNEKKEVLSIVPGKTIKNRIRYKKINNNWHLFKRINNCYSLAYFVGKYATTEDSYDNQKKVEIDLNKIILINHRKKDLQIIGIDNILKYLKNKNIYNQVEKFFMELTIYGTIMFHDQKQEERDITSLKIHIEKHRFGK